MFARYRWAVGTLMFLAGMINYLDRSALGVAAPFIVRDLQLDPAQLGIVFSSFSFGYAAFCFVGGYASDRFGPKTVMTVSMTAWSIFCGRYPLLPGFRWPCCGWGSAWPASC